MISCFWHNILLHRCHISNKILACSSNSLDTITPTAKSRRCTTTSSRSTRTFHPVIYSCWLNSSKFYFNTVARRQAERFNYFNAFLMSMHQRTERETNLMKISPSNVQTRRVFPHFWKRKKVNKTNLDMSVGENENVHIRIEIRHVRY